MIVANGSLIGRYRVQEIAGRGTSSIVYRALDPAGLPVAVKAIREELLVEAEIGATLQRFDREVLIGRALLHPQIVQLLESGEHNGLPYLVMEYVTGETFDALIRAHAPLPPAVARDIVVKVLGALEHAHARNVIHRDVKPANIVLRHPGAEPVLMDFGIAHLYGSDLTRHGELLGTPTYLAPEQLRGEPIDARADLFAAGVMLYVALTGRRPFDGSIADIMRRICFDDPVPVSQSAPELAPLDAIIARALAKQPADRYGSAAAFAAALAQVQFAPAPSDANPAEEATIVARSSGPVTLEELGALFERGCTEGVNETIVGHIEHLMTQVADQDRWQLAALCGGRIARLADLLLATAPLPGQKAARQGHWLSGIELFRLLLAHALRGPDADDAAHIAADVAYFLAAGILAYGSEVAERLTPDEAPDVGLQAMSLLRVDSIGFGLARLGASHERRLVEATGRVIAGQVLRRAAAVMDGYVASRDPLARFDVINMLVNVEDLIALAARLVDDTQRGAEGRPDPIASRSVAALSALLDAMTGLVEVSGGDLDAALSHQDDAELGVFLGHLKQMLMIHQFCTRLDGDLFQPRLALLSELVYTLATRLTGAVTSQPILSASQQERANALHEIASLAGWKELATRLLHHLCASLLA